MVISYREINQDALGREKSKMWHRKYRKAILFALIAVILAVLAYSVAQNALSTAQTNNVFEIVVNNTDLGQTNGTKERIWRTTYYANSSPIAISLLGHVVGTGAALEMNLNLTVNSTVIQDIDTMTNPGANIHDHASIYFIIPKGSNYSVDNSTSVSYLEWREYPILSGKNGTLSINQTVVSNITNQSIQITRPQVTGQEAIDTAQNASISSLQTNDTTVFIDYRNATNSPILPQSVFKIVNFTDKNIDTHNAFNGTSFISPVDGYYTFNINIGFAGSAIGDVLQITFYKNGSEYKRDSSVTNPSTNNWLSNTGISLHLNKSDVLEIYVLSSGTNSFLLGDVDSTQRTWITGVKVGN